MAKDHAMRNSSAFLLAVSAVLAIISSPALAQSGQNMMGNNGQGMKGQDSQ
jgi:hypothetical protein